MEINLKKVKGNKDNQKAICSILLILMLAMSLMMAFTQSSLAQVGVPQPVKTAGYISVAPQLLGVGQKATINLWLEPLPTTYLYSPYYQGFSGVTVTFMKPDGSKDSFAPVDGTGQFVAGQTEALGSIYFLYEPDVVGNWSVSFTMPTQNITDETGTVQYSECTSNTAYFTVQKDPVNAGLLNGYPWSQLPNENTFWSYPINSNNREWSVISGDWLGSNNIGNPINGATCRLWQPYGSGPNTAHIVWSQPLQAGGIIGGDYGSLSYTSAVGYSNAVIIDGKAIVNIPNKNEFECIELATGKVLYKASGQISGGIHIPGNANAQSWVDPSVVLASSYGAIPTAYLFEASGTTWNFYDPFTGTLMRSITNVTATPSIFTNGYTLIDGTPLTYGITSDMNKLFAWDMSKVIDNNWPSGITWTRPLPDSLLNNTKSFIGAQSLFGVSTDASTIVVKTINQYWGYSAKDGASLWNLTLTYPASANEQICLYGVDDFIVFDPVATTFHCYSMINGTELWTSPSFSSFPWATTWTVYYSETNDNNNFYVMFPDGTMAALSLATGQLVWHNTAIPSTEYTNNVVPYVSGMLMVGGNIYAYAGYSLAYQTNPIPRFAMTTCVNATTGNTTWTLNGGVWPIAAANGYVLGLGVNDGALYCIGKGQTSTTVTAQQQVGGSVLIQGSVLDQSAAQPNTAAISDSDMSVWMDYMNMQNATLLNNQPQSTGVPITLTAVDPNGNSITIGTTTSNYQGNYGFQWTPNMPGLYTVYATFAGSNSYYTSSASTYATVNIESSAPTSTSTPTANPPYEFYTIGMGVAVIVALAVAVLLLKKKP